MNRERHRMNHRSGVGPSGVFGPHSTRSEEGQPSPRQVPVFNHVDPSRTAPQGKGHRVRRNVYTHLCIPGPLPQLLTLVGPDDPVCVSSTVILLGRGPVSNRRSPDRLGRTTVHRRRGSFVQSLVSQVGVWWYEPKSKDPRRGPEGSETPRDHPLSGPRPRLGPRRRTTGHQTPPRPEDLEEEVDLTLPVRQEWSHSESRLTHPLEGRLVRGRSILFFFILFFLLSVEIRVAGLY